VEQIFILQKERQISANTLIRIKELSECFTILTGDLSNPLAVKTSFKLREIIPVTRTRLDPI
jgi:hypothetical protein